MPTVVPDFLYCQVECARQHRRQSRPGRSCQGEAPKLPNHLRDETWHVTRLWPVYIIIGGCVGLSVFHDRHPSQVP